MYKNTWLLLAIAAAACSSDKENTISGQQESEVSWRIDPDTSLNQFFECVETNGAAVVSAHRGGPYPGYPENALESMAALLEKAPVMMELDIATSADGVLYLMHDSTLERTTTGEGETNALVWDEIKDLRLEDNAGALTAFAPTRFDELLSWAKDRTILQLDIKRTTNIADVAAEVKRQQAEGSVIFITYSLDDALKAHQLLPEAMISVSINSQTALDDAVAAGVPADRIVAFTGRGRSRPELFSTLDGQDVEVIFGTLGGPNSLDNRIAASGDETRYAELVVEGVDIIASDRPIEAYAALKAADRALSPGKCGVKYGG